MDVYGTLLTCACMPYSCVCVLVESMWETAWSYLSAYICVHMYSEKRQTSPTLIGVNIFTNVVILGLLFGAVSVVLKTTLICIVLCYPGQGSVPALW